MKTFLFQLFQNGTWVTQTEIHEKTNAAAVLEYDAAIEHHPAPNRFRLLKVTPSKTKAATGCFEASPEGHAIIATTDLHERE